MCDIKLSAIYYYEKLELNNSRFREKRLELSAYYLDKTLKNAT